MNMCAVLLYSGHLVGCLLWFVASDIHTHPLRTSWAYAAGLNQANFYVQYVLTAGWDIIAQNNSAQTRS